MLALFKSWYKVYIERGNQKADDYLNTLREKLLSEKNNLNNIISVRMTTMMSGSTSELDEKINKKSEEVVDLEEKIIKITELRDEIKSKSSSLSAEKVYRKLTDHPKISKIEVKDNELHVITKNLKTQGQNIGHFQLTYNLNDRLYIKNLEYVVGGVLDHWHVKYGDPCLSEWRAVLWKSLDTFQLFMFVDTLIHYLLLSSSEHAYMPFEEWIRKFKEKEPVVKPQVSRSDLSENQEAYLQAGSIGTIVYSGTTTGWTTATSTVTDNTWTYWDSGTGTS